MKDQTKGAWIIHHTKKLQLVTSPNNFDEIHTAGKCGLLLSALAESDNNSEIGAKKVKAIAKASKITSLELPSILNTLQKKFLIDKTLNGDVAVLGLTTSTVLDHTAKIFSSNEPSTFEQAAIDLSESVSEVPLAEKLLKEKISDDYKISKSQMSDLIDQAEQMGFIDSELVDSGTQRLYFNGNLFKKENLQKTEKVLSTLTSIERKQFHAIDTAISDKGCIPIQTVITLSSNVLVKKLTSIGMLELNQVVNDNEKQIFVTKPAAFSKFGSPFEEDALDMAKAFVASLTYGMMFSVHSRGRIYDLGALIQKMLRGEEVGPTTSIGQDYKVLEFNRVVELRPDVKYPNRFWMRLLKKDVGQLALRVLESGDSASEESVLNFRSSSINQYLGPEFKREEIRRKKITTESSTQIYDALNSLRLSN